VHVFRRDELKRFEVRLAADGTPAWTLRAAKTVKGMRRPSAS